MKNCSSILLAKNMTVLSIDGPCINWKVPDLLKNHRDHNEFPQVFDEGTCVPHIVHGAFQTGVMWRFFNDTPARRDIYIQMNNTDLFPQMFCQTRWVEDESVASRAVNVWGYVAHCHCSLPNVN